MSDTLHPLEPFDHVRLKDGAQLWFSEEPTEVDSSSDPIYLVSAISPEDSEFKVPPHYHPYTDEYLRCLAGKLYVTIGGVEHTLCPTDGQVKIPKGVVHSILCPKGQYAEFQDRQDTHLVKKREFLRTLFVITESSASPLRQMIQILTLHYQDGDAVPGGVPKPIGTLIVWVVGGFLGTFLGLGKLKAKEV